MPFVCFKIDFEIKFQMDLSGEYRQEVEKRTKNKSFWKN